MARTASAPSASPPGGSRDRGSARPPASISCRSHGALAGIAPATRPDRHRAAGADRSRSRPRPLPRRSAPARLGSLPRPAKNRPPPGHRRPEHRVGIGPPGDVRDAPIVAHDCDPPRPARPIAVCSAGDAAVSARRSAGAARRRATAGISRARPRRARRRRFAALGGAVLAHLRELRRRAPLRPVATVREPVADRVEQVGFLRRAAQVPARRPGVASLVIAGRGEAAQPALARGADRHRPCRRRPRAPYRAAPARRAWRRRNGRRDRTARARDGPRA